MSYRIWKKHLCSYEDDEAKSCSTDVRVVPEEEWDEYGATRKRILREEEGVYFEDMGEYTKEELKSLFKDLDKLDILPGHLKPKTYEIRGFQKCVAKGMKGYEAKGNNAQQRAKDIRRKFSKVSKECGKKY